MFFANIIFIILLMLLNKFSFIIYSLHLLHCFMLRKSVLVSSLVKYMFSSRIFIVLIHLIFIIIYSKRVKLTIFSPNSWSDLPPNLSFIQDFIFKSWTVVINMKNFSRPPYSTVGLSVYSCVGPMLFNFCHFS